MNAIGKKKKMNLQMRKKIANDMKPLQKGGHFSNLIFNQGGRAERLEIWF